MSGDNTTPDPLAAYARTTKKSDAEIGRLIGASRWKVSRGRRGDPPFSVKDQLKLEAFTGVTPADWAEYYSKVLKERASEDEPAPTQKKSAVAEVA